MCAPVTVRPVDSVEEYYDAMRAVRLAWRAAFEDVLPESSLPGPDVPSDRLDELERAYEDVTANDAVFVAAADGGDATADSDGGATADSDGGATPDAGPSEPSRPAARVVGFAHAVRDADRTKPFVPDADTELRALYVRPERWGEGVGTALLERVESVATGDHLRLQTFADNENGRAFYRARGFDAVGDGAYDVGGESYPTVVFAKRVRS